MMKERMEEGMENEETKASKRSGVCSCLFLTVTLLNMMNECIARG